MIKKTFKELTKIDQEIATLYSLNPKLKDTKFGYTYSRFYDQNYEPTLKEFRKLLVDIRIDHALENPDTKEIITKPNTIRGFAYSKDGLKKVIKAEERIESEFDLKEIEIKPFISPFIPSELNEQQKELFNSLIISLEKDTSKKEVS